MKTKYILLTLIVACFFSCSDDILDQEPTNAVSDKALITDIEAAKTAIIGAYSKMTDFRYHTLAYITQDVMGQDLTLSSGAYGFPTYNWLIFSYQYAQIPESSPWWTGYSNYIWKYAYESIDQANTIIAAKETLLPEGETKEDLIAQAHGIRGFNFLLLAQLYSRAYTDQPNSKGLILRLTPGSSDESLDVGRSTVKESYEQIIADFTYLYEHSKQTEQQFLNKTAAALLLARTYLSMGNYEQADKYASLAAPSFDGSNLMTKEEYQAGFKDQNNEWLWLYKFTPSNNNIYASIPSFYWFCKEVKGYEYGAKVSAEDINSDNPENKAVDMLQGYSTIRATAAFRNLFDADDCRKLFPAYVFEEDGFFVSKFGHRSRIGDAEYPICRTAEAYLIKAEAALQLGNSDLSRTVLNALQKARGANETEATIDHIWVERRKELYGEGFALNDIKRLQKPLQRTGPDQWAGVKELPANSPRLMLPIPEKEMLYNKQLTKEDQNEYWQ